MEKHIIDIGGVPVGAGQPLLIVAGPCVIEDRATVFKTAEALKEITDRHGAGFLFKASYDKANRSSVRSFRGPGARKGIDLLLEVKKELGVPVTTDLHTPEEASCYGGQVDMLQVPALLSRQTDLILAVAGHGLPVNIKKGQFMAPKDMLNVIAKAESMGNKQIILTERGTTFGYNNLVVDFRSFEIMAESGYPVLFDATHSVQLPGGAGDRSTGERRFVPMLARAAAAAGVDGFFMEIHPDPDSALCDGPNMLSLEAFDELLPELIRINNVVKK